MITAEGLKNSQFFLNKTLQLLLNIVQDPRTFYDQKDFFFWPNPRYMEVPGPGIKLNATASTRAAAVTPPDPESAEPQEKSKKAFLRVDIYSMIC